MATIEQNIEMWNDSYDWKGAGDEWSNMWGGVEMQWYGVILPRIQSHLPAHTILEIAPGYGRWTAFLKGYCKNLIVVDLSEKCIEACRERFGTDSHITYHVNDGKSLDMIEDESIDFVFSFDSLVHVEADTMKVYLAQLVKKFRKGGTGFIHHSNIGEYKSHYDFINKLPRGKTLLGRLGLIEETDCWRAFSMTAARFREIAEEVGLQCTGQELINWQTKRLIDCMSAFGTGSGEPQIPRVVQNPKFMDEARRLKQLAEVYGNRVSRPSA